MKNSFFKKLFKRDKSEISKNNNELSQSELNSEQITFFRKILIFFKSIIPKMRFGFASACENSRIVCFVEELYAGFLSCQARVLGVYFLTFSLVSMFIKYFNFDGFFEFLFSNEIIPLLFIFIISLILFASKKEIGKLITESVLMSGFRITYSQAATVAFYTAKNAPQGFSTAFFLGIFSAFLTIIYPIYSVFAFLAIILFLLCSINRPESSLLFSVFLIPFLNTKGLFLIILITFFSLFYKFLRCKRHISFGITEILMLILGACFATSASLNNESVIIVVKYLLPLILGFVCMNIVRSTSMLKACHKMLIAVCSIYALIVLVLYAAVILFGYKQVMDIADARLLSSLVAAITNKQFSLAFTVICAPIIFARLISTRLPFHLFILIVLLLYSSAFCTFYEILIIVISCLVVMCFYNIKNIFLVIVAPLIAYLITLPGSYLSGLLHFRIPKEAKTFVLDKFISEFKNNILFGNGFLSEKIHNTGLGSLILSCGLVGTLVLLVLVIRIIIKNIRFSVSFDLTKTGIRAISASLCASGISLIVLSFFSPVFSDLRCICLYALVVSLTRNVPRCVKSDFIDPYSVRDYEI